MTNEITEADRAVARRVIRSLSGSADDAPVYVDLAGRFLGGSWFGLGGFGAVNVSRNTFASACLAAAQGRAYAKALRGAK